jgi:hypothetical protein
MRKTPLIFALFSLLIPLQLQAATETSQYITMNLPEAVIEKSMKQILPLSLEGSSSTLEGTITVMDITDLRIKNQQILFHLDIMGNNLHLVTRVANQDIRLKLGSARVEFLSAGPIRYDAAKQTLFIRPTASDVQGSEALSKGDIGQTLLLFLNGREFPLTMQNLEPIITEASDKIITINTKIVDVKGVEGALQLSLSPTVTASPRQAAVQQ